MGGKVWIVLNSSPRYNKLHVSAFDCCSIHVLCEISFDIFVQLVGIRNFEGVTGVTMTKDGTENFEGVTGGDKDGTWNLMKVFLRR